MAKTFDAETPRFYEVLSDNFSGHAPGSFLREDELDGLNIEALITAGHIVAQKPAEAGTPPAELKEQ